MEGRPPPTDLMIADLTTCIDALFVFALVWSIGATTNEDGRYFHLKYLSFNNYTYSFHFQQNVRFVFA